METGQALDGQPRSRLRPQKKRRDRLLRFAEHHPDLALGFEEEVWWSRAAQPPMHTWCEEEPLHLVEKQVAPKDPDAQALACSGLSLPTSHQRLLRFVCRPPVRTVPCLFLAWRTTSFATQGTRALVLRWDNASWPISHEVRQWRRAHNRPVK